MRAKSIFIHVLVGSVLGAVFGLLIGWSTTGHNQYLIGNGPYQVLALGGISGAFCGLTLDILKRNIEPTLPESIFLGSGAGLIISLPLVSYNFSPLWGLVLVAGAIFGLLIHVFKVTSKLDEFVRRTFLENETLHGRETVLILAHGAVNGAVLGAIVTMIMILVYIETTLDPDLKVFPRVQMFYLAVPFGALLCGGWNGMRMLWGKKFVPPIPEFSRAMIAGILMGLELEIGLAIMGFEAFFIITSTVLFLTVFITFFAVTVSMISQVFLTLLKINS